MKDVYDRKREDLRRRWLEAVGMIGYFEHRIKEGDKTKNSKNTLESWRATLSLRKKEYDNFINSIVKTEVGELNERIKKIGQSVPDLEKIWIDRNFLCLLSKEIRVRDVNLGKFLIKCNMNYSNTCYRRINRPIKIISTKAIGYVKNDVVSWCFYAPHVNRDAQCFGDAPILTVLGNGNYEMLALLLMRFLHNYNSSGAYVNLSLLRNAYVKYPERYKKIKVNDGFTTLYMNKESLT